MILIADSGSTKTDWRLLTQDTVTEVATNGINPFYQSPEEILEELNAKLLPRINSPVREIYFYGAGCATDTAISSLKGVFAKAFPEAQCSIHSDLLAAARSLCKDKPGIACILGTGMNTCYYNGTEITDNIPPLGYMLGDEGSGAVLGRKIVVAYLRRYMPDKLMKRFNEKYNTNKAEILEAVYKRPFPNRYLAGFTRFLTENINETFIHDLVYNTFCEFLENNVLHYENVNRHKIHFVGSIAHYFLPILKEAAHTKGVQIGTILQSPIEGLTEFHLKTLQ